MSKKKNTINKSFRTVRDKLEYIQKECNEPELFEDLKQLFKAKGFSNVEITHGSKEYGKDLVFSKIDDAFGDEVWYCSIVKNKSATQNDFLEGGEIENQIQLSYNVPYINSNGKTIDTTRIFIVINGKVTENARNVLAKKYNPQQMSTIKIWNYQNLASEIEDNIKTLFLDNIEPAINIFARKQISRLSDISRTSQLFDLNLGDIDDIFVNAQTTYTKHVKQVEGYVDFDGDLSKKSKKKVELDEAQEIVDSSNNFIIHGIATSGKTLLLKRIGIKALKDDTLNRGVFFFEALDIFKIDSNFNVKIEELVAAQFEMLSEGEKYDPSIFQEVIILFDAIDELREKKSKFAFYEFVERIIKDYSDGKLKVVIATKTTEIIENENILGDLEKCELLPFNVGQAFQLVNKLIPNDKKKSLAFTEAIKDSMLNSSILRTPLALTLMAILYRDDAIDLKELPANVTELYSKFVETYLDRWDSNKGITQQYKYEQTKIILAYVAFEIHTSDSDFISEEKLTEKLVEFRQKYNYEELDDIQQFVNHLKYKKGVFNYDETNEQFYFFNHFFQEYFVSLHVDEDTETKLKERFFDEWWENAIVFYCGKNPKRDVFINDAVKSLVPVELKDKYNYLQLLSKCLQANHSILIESRIKVISKMIFEFDKFHLMFLAGGVEGKTFAAGTTTIDLVLNFRDFFEKLFSSKHISNKECLEYFESLILPESGLSETTRYCIAYFYSFKVDNSVPLELFVEDDNLDIFWQRILMVDLEALNFKKKDIKAFQNMKKKVRRNKFLIQSRLKGISTQILLEKETHKHLDDLNYKESDEN